MQALPSLHPVPLDLGVVEHAPFEGLHVPELQALFSDEQSTAVPETQVSVARLHVSTPLQALLSLQFALLVQPHALVFTVHPPAASLQPSTVQATPSSHTRAGPPHTPLVQVSGVVQALPSLHVVPFVFTGFEHTPVDVLQVPALWH